MEHKDIETILLPIFRRQAKPITAADACRMAGQKFPLSAIRSACGHLTSRGILHSRPSSGEKSTRLYELVDRPVTKTEQRHWTPLRPARQTVIPVSSGGRLAPDVSDGVYIAMVSKAEYYGRVDA
jgi:hypothetical protein